MGGKLRFLLLSAILGLTTAEIKINGTPENVSVSWKPSTGQNFKEISIYRDTTEIVKAKAESLDKPTVLDGYTVSCVATKSDKNAGYCVIGVKDITAANVDQKYNAKVKWSDKGTDKEESAEDGNLVCVMGKATTPKVEEISKDGDSVLLNCTSHGVPAPKLTWTDVMDTNVNEVEHKNVWDTATRRYISSSTYKVKSYKEYYVFNCTAQQPDLDDAKNSCKYKDTTRFTNFLKVNKPTIELTKDANNKIVMVNCTAHGIPSPDLRFNNVANLNKDFKNNTLSKGPYWDVSTNSFKISIAMNTTDMKMTVTCSSQQEIKYDEAVNQTSTALVVNSAVKFGTPSGVVAALMAVALFTQQSYRI